MFFIALIFLVLLVIISPVIGFITCCIVGILFIAISLSIRNSTKIKEEERKNLIDNKLPKICIHCRKEVDPMADICPYCNFDPYN